MAKLLNDENERRVQEVFKSLKKPVQIIFFASELRCEYCESARELLEEVSGLSDKISLAAYDLEKDQDLAKQYGIDKAPGFTIVAKNGEETIDYGIRFYGIPSGHEFTTLINDLVMVSTQTSGLGDYTSIYLRRIKTPLHLQVFTTPT
jgi:alkyl hydroperoxide reductase subunit AhpF